ncbi:MAG: aspartate 1-decarboxylase [Bacteroidota bacterium]
MTITMFKSKLHQMVVTEANLNYEGSITIDQDLLDAAKLLPYEKVQVLNITNGQRIETYTIPGERGKRECCLNGAAARLFQPDDRIIVISYAEMTPEEASSHKPRVVVVDEHNDPKSILDYSQPATSFSLETGLVN